jgi:PadR family transcriptional regulator PadR
MGIRDNFKKGTVEMLVLSLLAESDLYGYQFSSLISERSGGVIDVPEGSLYPMLYRLVDEGFISCTKVPAGRRRILVYYHIEHSGLERLREMVSEYRIFSEGLEKFLDSCNFPSKEVHDHA